MSVVTIRGNWEAERRKLGRKRPQGFTRTMLTGKLLLKWPPGSTGRNKMYWPRRCRRVISWVVSPKPWSIATALT